MNPHLQQPTSLFSLAKSLFQHNELILQMIKREVIGRYKGSVMGLLWSFIIPVLMLVVYTFVFSVVFKARWGVGAEDGNTNFAVILFVGLIAHGLLAEVLNHAPTLILRNVNYVKKVVFPLEILSVVSLGAALFHSLVSIVVLLIVLVIINNFLYWTVLLIPIVLLPLIILALGLSLFLASLGVYIRDVKQTVGIITTVLLFLSPVFYPLSRLPADYQIYIMINPLTFIIEQAREILIWGNQPDWNGLLIYLVISISVLWVGYAWFQKTRKGFADVL